MRVRDTVRSQGSSNLAWAKAAPPVAWPDMMQPGLKTLCFTALDDWDQEKWRLHGTFTRPW